MSRLFGMGLVAILWLLALVGCGGPSGPGAGGGATPTQAVVATATEAEEATATVETAEGTATATEEAEATAEPSATATPTAEQGGTAEPVETQVVEPTATVQGGGGEGQTPPPVDLSNPWPKILSVTPAPEGWSVQPCEGDAPVLCVGKRAENVGYVTFNSFPLETMTDFQRMLADAGLDAGSFDYTKQGEAEKAREALHAFVENYHEIFMEDREATFQGQKRYERLETKDASVGELPGVSYGFAIVNPDGSVHERWLSYSAFDGEGLLTIVASYYPGQPDAPFSFRSDEELLEFERVLAEIVKGLKLPHPEVKGDKHRG